MPRLFTGLEIPLDEAARLQSLTGGLEGARWIDPMNYHITLRFLGDIDEPTAMTFLHRLYEVEARPFRLRLSGLGSFGHGKPRALWAGVEVMQEDDGALTALQKAHERAAQAAGLAPERRKFTPHLTLARLKGTRPEMLARYLEAHGGFQGAFFEVRSFALFSSRPSMGGGPYLIEQLFPLREAGEDEGVPGEEPSL